MYQQRMLSYYPQAIKSIVEFQSIIEGEHPEFKFAAEGVQNILSDAYLRTMSEERIAQWEKQLGIVPESESTVSDRRDVLIATIRGQGKLNTELINKIVHTFTGSTAKSYVSDGVLYVAVKPSEGNKIYSFSNLEKALSKKVPAHLRLYVTLDHVLWENVNYNHNSWENVNASHRDWESVLHGTHKQLTLDDIAWGGKTYRELFLTNNIFAKGNAITDITNDDWTQYNSIPKPVPTTEHYNTSPNAWDCSGSTSVQMYKDLNLPIGDNFYIACKRKLTSYTAGRWCGIEVYYLGGAGLVISDTADANGVSETFETFSHTFTPKTATTQIWVGSGGSANLTGYIDDLVCINLTEMFGDVTPTKAEMNKLYENFVSLVQGKIITGY